MGERWGQSPHDPYAIRQSELDRAIDEGRAVLVEGLTKSVLRFQLSKMFSTYGDVDGIDMPIFKTSGQNRGTAVVVFGSARAASKASSHMGTGLIDGQQVQVKVQETSHGDTYVPPPRR